MDVIYGLPLTTRDDFVAGMDYLFSIGVRSIDDATMAGPRLRATLEKDLQALAPLVDYLCAALVLEF